MSEHTVREVLEFVAENDVKFIRLMFTDIFGGLKNIAVLPRALERAFADGIAFDASGTVGYEDEASDLFLLPDPATLAVLPWRPQSGRVARMYCSVLRPDGSPAPTDGRHLLRQAERRAEQLGLAVSIGPECEFYLFKTDENGSPTGQPQDTAGYLDVAPLDGGENVRREICLTLEEMGIRPERSHHERGPGQNEIGFCASPPLAAADDLTTFRAVVASVAAVAGLAASFDPKPLPAEPGSGLHVNLSVRRNGKNLFEAFPKHSEAAQFAAGVLRRVPEITAVLNPVPGSYARFGAFGAPRASGWAVSGRNCLMRVPAEGGARARIELRSSDPAADPYLSFALLVRAGIEGIEQALALPPPAAGNAEPALSLPRSLSEALTLFECSAFAKEALGVETVRRYAANKRTANAARG